MEAKIVRKSRNLRKKECRKPMLNVVDSKLPAKIGFWSTEWPRTAMGETILGEVGTFCPEILVARNIHKHMTGVRGGTPPPVV